MQKFLKTVICEVSLVQGTKDTVDKANELLDNFSNMLEKRGIKVDRPTPIDFNQKTSTPDWEAETMFGCMPPWRHAAKHGFCLLYTSPSPRDKRQSRMPSSA